MEVWIVHSHPDLPIALWLSQGPLWVEIKKVRIVGHIDLGLSTGDLNINLECLLITQEELGEADTQWNWDGELAFLLEVHLEEVVANILQSLEEDSVDDLSWVLHHDGYIVPAIVAEKRLLVGVKPVDADSGCPVV